MYGRNSLWPCLLAAAVVQVAPVESAIAQEAVPVQELRERQQRLNDLEYAIQEAELLHRLCSLAPTNPECHSTHQQSGQDPGASVPNAQSDYRLIEVFGSEGRLRAVLAERDGTSRTVQVGSELAFGVHVDRIRRDSVQLLAPAGASTLRIGER